MSRGPARRFRVLHASLLVSLVVACEPSPEKACANAAQVSPELDVATCVNDLRTEKDDDPVEYEQDVACLSGLRAGAKLQACLASLRSLPGVQRRIAEAERKTSGRDADLTAKMDELRAAVERVKDSRQRAAFAPLLQQAGQMNASVRGQLGAAAVRDGGGSEPPGVSR